MNPIDSKWLTLSLLVLVGCLVFALLGMGARRAEFQQAVLDSEKKVQEAEEDKAYFERFTAYFRSSQFLERQAKMKLNYKSPEEQVAFVFRDPNPKREGDSGNWLNEASNYKKWWYYLLGY